MLTASEQQAGIADAGERSVALEPCHAPIRKTASTGMQQDPLAARATTPNGAAKRVEPAAFDQRGDRFVVNVTSSIAYVVLNTMLMIWYVPFLIGHLGVASYGMVALVNSLFMISIVVTDSLTGGTFRYLAIDLNRGDASAAQRTFNTALALAVIGCGVLMLPIAAAVYYLPTLFQIPQELVSETRFLLLSTSLLAFTSLLGGTFGASSLIVHRFDLRNIVRALTTLGRVGVVALCFMIWPASLWHVGAGMIAAALVGLAGDVILWQRLTPQLGIQPRLIDSSQFRPLIGISGWSAVNTVGALLLMQIDLLVVNAFFGSETTGRYGSVILLPTLIYTLMEAVIPILSPAIMASFATGDIGRLRRTALQSVRLLALTLALPVGLLCGLGGPLLSLWLGPTFADLDIILFFLVGHLTVTLATRPLSYVLTAHNKVKVQGLVSMGLGVANFALVIALARYSGFGAAGVAAAGALTWTVRNGVILSTYSATLMGLRWHAFYGPLALGVCVTVAVALAGQVSVRLWWPSDWVSLATTAAAISLAYCGVAYAIGLTAAERALLRGGAKRWTSCFPRHTR